MNLVTFSLLILEDTLLTTITLTQSGLTVSLSPAQNATKSVWNLFIRHLWAFCK